MAAQKAVKPAPVSGSELHGDQPSVARQGDLVATDGRVAGQVVEPALELLFEKSCVLAERVRAGGLAFNDAVDLAYSAADWAGLVDRYGDDRIQSVLASAFMETPRGCHV